MHVLAIVHLHMPSVTVSELSKEVGKCTYSLTQAQTRNSLSIYLSVDKINMMHTQAFNSNPTTEEFILASPLSLFVTTFSNSETPGSIYVEFICLIDPRIQFFFF